MTRILIWLVLIVGVMSGPALAQDFRDLEVLISNLERETGGRIGIAFREHGSESGFFHRADERFPMASTFKAPLCGAVLEQVDRGDLTLKDEIEIKRSELVTYSPVTERLAGTEVSIGELCAATLEFSDNTAANLLLEILGGPLALTKFYRALGDPMTQSDRYEPELNEGRPGDPRDTTTPRAMVGNIEALLLGSALQTKSTEMLTQWMKGNRVSDALIRKVLPPNWQIADRSGAGGYGTRGIVGVLYPADQAPYVIAIYLTENSWPFSRRNEIIAEIADAIIVQIVKE